MEVQMSQDEAKGQATNSQKVKQGQAVRLSFSNHD